METHAVKEDMTRCDNMIDSGFLLIETTRDAAGIAASSNCLGVFLNGRNTKEQEVSKSCF
jgi:hypothetical protein